MNERLLNYQARLSVYALLQRLYQDPPRAELLEWLMVERPFANFPIQLDDEVQTDLEGMDSSLAVNSLEDLRLDFKQLFIGPGAMLAPPWESVYRNEEHLIFDRHTLEVREFYARHGMEFVRINQAPEDSITMELEFMKVLTERVLQALEMDDPEAERILLEEQLAFLNKHLLIWTPDFIKMTQTRAATAFYAGLASVLRGFLNWERQTLALLLASLTAERAESELMRSCS